VLAAPVKPIRRNPTPHQQVTGESCIKRDHLIKLPRRKPSLPQE
jgi:hypothetical protein